MEKHAIPRDVTGFQFKLIGDMTLKQFAYLATGCILGYIFFSLPIAFFIKIPIAFLFVIMGISLAFLPISGRPLDTMLSLFIKALFTPNQYIFQKTNTQTNPITSTLANQPKSNLDKKEEVYMQSVVPINMPTSIPPTTNSLNVASPQEEKVLEEESIELKKEIEQVKKEELESHDPKILEKENQKIAELEKKLAEVTSQKEELEKKLLLLSEKPNESIPKPTPPVNNPTPNTQTPPIRSDFANVIKGIVKDPRGNVLSNILVEVQDKEGNPVRAFKTNNLGRFASATALLNGTYTVHFEDPNEKNNFDSATITASGQEIAPLEIVSTDAREKLRRELFG